MFFAKPGRYKECGMFTLGHFIILSITLLGVWVGLKSTKRMEKNNVHKIIKRSTVIIWILEIVMIIFKISICGVKNLNSYVPLYYCGTLLYAGILSSFTNGKFKRIGDVFIATGGIIGGIVFLIMPTTSLPEYPLFHVVSIHSFFFHGLMLYLGLLVNKSNYIQLKKSDIKYYITIIGVLCTLAYILNTIFNSNLMFISSDFPGTPLHLIYELMGKYYTAFMIIIQITIPFYLVYGSMLLYKKIKSNNISKQNIKII